MLRWLEAPPRHPLLLGHGGVMGGEAGLAILDTVLSIGGAGAGAGVCHLDIAEEAVLATGHQVGGLLQHALNTR